MKNTNLIFLNKQWVFPVDRFVEYEEKDEGWCRALGIGQEEDIISKLPFPTTIEDKEVNFVMKKTWCLLFKEMGLIPVLQHAETYKLKYYK